MAINEMLNYEAGTAADKWIREHIADHNCDYVCGYRQLKKELKAEEARRYQRAAKAQSERETYVRNYAQELNAPRREAERHVDQFMPRLRRHYEYSQTARVAELIREKSGGDRKSAMRFALAYFAENRSILTKCAAEYLDWAAQTETDPNKKTYDRNGLREVMSQHPDISAAYQHGQVSEFALRKMFPELL